VLPSQYTLESAPCDQPDVRLVQVPRAGGCRSLQRLWSRRITRGAGQLTAFAQQRGLQLTGEPVYARYDPPFMPWFLRRNEILVEIAR